MGKRAGTEEDRKVGREESRDNEMCHRRVTY
jgi:hypothetical protein